VIENTYNLVFGYAINSGCYDCYGSAGWKVLEQTISYIRQVAPGLPIIFEGNTGNVPETAQKYAEAAFDHLQADAVVVNPYMGSPTPYLNRKDKGIFILCRTSNPKAGEIQDLPAGKDRLLYEAVAEHVRDKWNHFGNCGFVVGSPFPIDIASVRKLAPTMPILTPGIGVQGGKLKDTIEAGMNKSGTGLILWMSRTILYGQPFDSGRGPRKAIVANNKEVMAIQKELRTAEVQ
jgi:orotidine 5'-phosphate decarboxylase subfamily 2